MVLAALDAADTNRSKRGLRHHLRKDVLNPTALDSGYNVNGQRRRPNGSQVRIILVA